METHPIDQLKTGDGIPAREAEANGELIIAETLEELAEKIGFDPQRSRPPSTASMPNVDAKSDEFGRTLYSPN
jgi:hypothetical protein